MRRVCYRALAGASGLSSHRHTFVRTVANTPADHRCPISSRSTALPTKSVLRSLRASRLPSFAFTAGTQRGCFSAKPAPPAAAVRGEEAAEPTDPLSDPDLGAEARGEEVDFEPDDNVIEDYDDEEETSEDGEYDEDFVDPFEELEDSVDVNTGGVAWGTLALECAREALRDPSIEAALALYSFQAVPRSRIVAVRLDKLTDKYGSPVMDDIVAFNRVFHRLLEERGFPEDCETEVSSPGADRIVKVPDELVRFQAVPMAVKYRSSPTKEGKQPTVTTKAMNLKDVQKDAGLCSWTLADVRANKHKGRPLTKKQKATVIDIALEDIVEVRIHVDF